MKLNPRVIAGGAVIYVGMTTATYLYMRSSKPQSCSCSPHTPNHDQNGDADIDGNNNSNGIDTFNRIAASYDKTIDLDETLMGVRLLRRLLLRQAQGDVLEVSAGTGRNVPYYRAPQVASVLMTDASRPMLLQAAEKAASLSPAKERTTTTPHMTFCLADVQHLCADDTSGDGNSININNKSSNPDSVGDVVATQPSIPGVEAETTKYGPALRRLHTLPPESYDTVVDTFGLCSCEDPVQALKEMGSVVKAGGKILLLEHGRGTWQFINKILDSSALEHRKKWGCAWNRDIEALVKEAQLEVESISRWHFGTTYVIVAKKKRQKDCR